ncbi:hypothetical protein [Nonomuraea turcica]|uniref:hypothetical protein n=1 Tax=Nonomuraea sp. G32 TaxID=3067274 RepID=UPI00273BA86D|nr:hypothetical protein [Nonomuraea sp. G32]MDP4501712.1 hypothetical protein [Nonomuraea sp. G32]
MRGRTALCEAVFNDRPENARALVAAGADPWWRPNACPACSSAPGVMKAISAGTVAYGMYANPKSGCLNATTGADLAVLRSR